MANDFGSPCQPLRFLTRMADSSHIVFGIEDISLQRETHAQMEKLAFYDPLTGLENRRLFKDRLDQCLKHVRRNKTMMALLFLDLDQFKRINDTLGHDAGDELLCTVARRIKNCVREEDIVARLGGDEFTILLPVVYFQPQIDLLSNTVCGFEALVRWQHAEVDMIPPDRFIPVAEETGLIVELGAIVLRKACQQLKHLQSLGYVNQTMAVNLSARQFRDDNLIDMVKLILKETNLEARWLELEITESMLMDDIDQAIVILQQLKELGLTISIDDFGTGYSSLNYLTRLPIDKLKVDRSFVCNLPHNKSHMAITTAIIAMAQKLDMQVVAEGVETTQQVDFLRLNQCNVLQGYLFCKPVSSADLVSHITRVQSALDSSQDLNAA